MNTAATHPQTGSLNLGMIGNCAISALIDDHARMVWCCLPRFDGDPVFNALLQPGDEGSHFAIELEDLASAHQWYEPNTAILRTQLFDKAGHGIEITDFAPRFYSRSRYFRPMTLVRRVRPIQGSPRIRVALKVRYDWGQTTPEITRGSNHIRYVGESMTLRLSTDAPVSHVLSGQAFVLTREHNFLLGADETLVDGIADTARHFEQETTAYWRSWSRALAIPLEWQDAVIRAAITLKLSLYEETGAIVAAMTTSIPEAAGSERNWDYRYAWVRDSTFALWGLYTLGLDREADDFFSFIADVSGANNGERHPLQVMYAVGGERELVEDELNHLSGYDNARPVRIGNGAYNQRQHDIWGTMLDSVYLHAKSREQISDQLWPVLKEQVEEAIKHWREPDRGIWEVRGEPQHFTSSKVMCWVALDRGSKLAELQGEKSYAQQWRAIAEEIKFAKQLCARHNWPVIDVTRKSIEETAAAIVALRVKQR